MNLPDESSPETLENGSINRAFWAWCDAGERAARGDRNDNAVADRVLASRQE